MGSNDTTGNGYQETQLPNKAEVEKLVQTLYHGGQSQVFGTNDGLLKLQRSQQGWQIADQLLESVYTESRYFGAQTFNIKIERDWESLSDEDASQLLDRLITWLIRLINVGDSRPILKKLCGALVSYYLRPSGPWNRCIRHLILSLHVGKPVSVRYLLDTCFSL